ncbi:kinase [Tsuneonella sp. CC-YZS046]|uniref:kinase n=1 Tax=Tsuneonella sp. CC-YZS046 TaxID=3042152 RepID=UPI002D76A174|nr:kinase [Tsuneonella sp. CC-YZS046]WRO66425.1 kinase [Tsuneonella sp. CC-YZS046]
MSDGPDPALVAAISEAIERRSAARGGELLVVGICGAQGSGKTTLAGAVAQALRSHGTATAVLSLDDLYLTRAERRRLAREVHPLFATRGVPGTHDVALGLATLDSLARGDAAELPRFDKAADDRAPRQQWDRAPERTRVVLFEGWCVGAMPQGEDALIAPVNVLEASEDAQGIWRRHANHALAGPYAALFGRIGLLVLLAAPGFEVVRGWREQQEAELRKRAGPDASGVMSPGEVERFIRHYERLTRHILQEMPARADLVVRLGPDRRVERIETRMG